MDEVLGKFFMRHEFACPCCGKDDVKIILIDALDELRERAGEPITIVSGVRCEAHNMAVKGGAKSCHLSGLAGDIHIRNYDLFDMYKLAVTVRAFKNGGLGLIFPYHGSPLDGNLHVDVRGYAARWGYEKGKEIKFDRAMMILSAAKNEKKITIDAKS